MDRRSFLAGATMTGGLLAGYGMFGLIAGRFLYPASGTKKAWLFVVDAARLRPGASMTFRTPTGASIAIARRGDSGGVDDFLALSDVCPHLGCKVHWEPHNGRFFCPCHNGVFDSSGKATSGPPADAGQSLPRYPLRIENGLLYIHVPVESV